MEPPSKRPRQTRKRLTFAEKIEVLRRLHNGEKQVELAKELGCSKRALSRLKQDRHYFEQLELKPADSNRKSRRAVRHVNLENKLVDFFALAKRNGFPVSSNAVCRGAVRLRELMVEDPSVSDAEKCSIKSFQASLNWSKAFIKRTDLRSSDVKYLSVPREGQLNAVRELKVHLSDYELDCIIAVDRVNFFYELLPNDMNVPAASDPGASNANPNITKRVTMLLAANTTGTLKVPVTVVCNEKAPQCFQERSSPLPYLWHQCGWVSQTHFRAWFYSIFLPVVRKYTTKRVALILDKEWHSPDIADNRGQVTIIAVSTSLTNAAQKAMSGSVMSMLRRNYRYALAERIMQNAWPAQTPHTLFARHSEVEGLLRGEAPNLYDATNLVHSSWDDIPAQFIARCWLETAILPEQHAAQLFSMHGRHEKCTPDQMFFSCYPETRRDSLRVVQSFVRDGPPEKESIHESIAKRISGVGQKTLDRWLDAEEIPLAQRWMEAELEDIVSRFGPVAPASDGSIPLTDVSKFCAVREVHLPSVGCMMDLLAPIQSIVDECESGRATTLLYELKQELARVRASQEQQREQVVKALAPAQVTASDQAEKIQVIVAPASTTRVEVHSEGTCGLPGEGMTTADNPPVASTGPNLTSRLSEQPPISTVAMHSHSNASP
ncbi:Tigger transposable element-derived protein 4 [Gracilariopsis chorda]|uniref:Tigger transposable element-derived protein 4 n=1 Tax=Gracilariopsis chorda TaxID=448386 RepID=A0A2V3J2Q1_9FLOR|nr:Tigger transposable element-derived protein 4 [Gracilariopsis chorda]|eukprot:PXF48613.1 Tigger transposable element-derived protein 4 [Gracilariopsis chorda]